MSDDDIRTMVKEWLQCQNRKSYQLAEEIGIRPQTFYAQMSVRKISANTKKALSRIIPELAADADLNASFSEKENNPEKLKIKEWLRTHGKTRQWLAEAFANMDRPIAPDGSQPEELKRAEPWQYSVYTLQAWGYLVQIAERMGDKNYRYRKTAAGASIQKAADYLLPFRTHPEAWPWKGSRAGTPLPAIFEPSRPDKEKQDRP